MGIEVDIPEAFRSHIDAAVVRLRYLYPSWEISASVSLIKVTNIAPSDGPVIQREINYAIYRERIRSEGAPLRELLLKSVMA